MTFGSQTLEILLKIKLVRKKRTSTSEEEIDYNDEIRLTVKSGNVIVFPSTHLHATVPNTSRKTRFSIDFRIINKSFSKIQ